MRIAFATGQPLAQLLEADTAEVATWLELIEERNEAQKIRRR